MTWSLPDDDWMRQWPPPIGSILRAVYGPQETHAQVNKRFEVRGHVDDHIIVRRWLKRKRYWLYEVLDPIWWHCARDHLKVDQRRQRC